MWHAVEEACWTWILPLEYEHLCPRRANFDGSVQFPSEAPKKRLIQSFSSHLDDPEVRGRGSRQSWRGLHSTSVLCLNHPYFFDALLFLCTRPYWKNKVLNNMDTACNMDLLLLEYNECINLTLQMVVCGVFYLFYNPCVNQTLQAKLIFILNCLSGIKCKYFKLSLFFPLSTSCKWLY